MKKRWLIFTLWILSFMMSGSSCHVSETNYRVIVDDVIVTNNETGLERAFPVEHKANANHSILTVSVLENEAYTFEFKKPSDDYQIGFRIASNDKPFYDKFVEHEDGNKTYFTYTPSKEDHNKTLRFVLGHTIASGLAGQRSVYQNIDMTIVVKDTNAKPQIKSISQLVDNQELEINDRIKVPILEAYTLKLNAFDADDDFLTYNIEASDNLEFTQDNNKDTFTCIPDKQGFYDITLKVHDGFEEVSKQIRMQVLYKPQIKSITKIVNHDEIEYTDADEIFVIKDKEFSFKINTLLENQSQVFSIEGKLKNKFKQDDIDKNIFSFTPNKSDDGKEIIFKVANDIHITTRTIKLKVNDHNNKPVIENMKILRNDQETKINDDEEIFIAVGDEVNLWLEASDDDNDNLQYMVDNLFIQDKDLPNVFTWTATEGSYDVSIKVRDVFDQVSKNIHIISKPKPEIKSITRIYNDLGTNFTNSDTMVLLDNNEVTFKINLKDENTIASNYNIRMYNVNKDSSKTFIDIPRASLTQNSVNKNTFRFRYSHSLYGIFDNLHFEFSASNEVGKSTFSIESAVKTTKNHRPSFGQNMNLLKNGSSYAISNNEITVDKKETFGITMDYSDEDLDKFTLYTVNTPLTFEYVENAHMLICTPEKAGIYHVSFKGHDGFETTENTRDLTIYVGTPPVINSIKAIQDTTETIIDQQNTTKLIVGEKTLFRIDASPQNNDLTYIVEGDLKDKVMQSTEKDNEFVYTPTEEDHGKNILFKVSNDALEITKTITVAINHPPVIDGLKIQQDHEWVSLNDTEVILSEDEEIALKIDGSDQDNDSLTYSAVAIPEITFIQDSQDPSIFRWTPDSNHTGNYDVAFAVNDTLKTIFNRIKIKVKNRQPVINSIKAIQYSTETIIDEESNRINILAEGKVLFKIDASPKDISLSYIVEGDLKDKFIQSNENNNEFVYKPTIEDKGKSIQFKVLNGTEETTRAITVFPNQRPSIKGFKLQKNNDWSLIKDSDTKMVVDLTVTAGEEIAIKADGFDEDNDPLTYTFQSSDGANFVQDNQDKSIVRWTPSSNDIGEHTLAFMVKDSYGGVFKGINIIVVESVNRPPTIHSISACFNIWDDDAPRTVIDSVYEVDERDMFDGVFFIIDANDPDGDSITYATDFVSKSGIEASILECGIQGNPNIAHFYRYDSPLEYPIRFTVSDGENSTSEDILLKIKPLNEQ